MERLRKYAQMAVKTCVNIQKGQLLIINSDIIAAPLTRMVVEEAYLAGASEVIVQYNDSYCHYLDLKYSDEASLSNFPQWKYEQKKSWVERKAAFLNIVSSYPDRLNDIDPDRIQKQQRANSQGLKDFRYYTASNFGQWSVVIYPTMEWAKKVYPELEENEALNQIWKDLFDMCYINLEDDPNEHWKAYSQSIVEHGKVLTSYQFQSLHFKNNLGTDLTVDLVENHQWDGGMEYTPEGVGFIPNMPTIETFCMPHRDGVNGKVVATKPLQIQGKIVEDFYFKFKDGKVVDYGAKRNVESLKALLEMDEGAKHLGEVALVSYDTPISLKNTLYFNGMIDENASCHLALGACYPTNIKGGAQLTEEALTKLGANQSMIHCDFMFGSEDLSVVGMTKDGHQIVIFKNGCFKI